MTPDEYFAAIEERQVRGSTSLSTYYGLNVRQLTPDEAIYTASHHERVRSSQRQHGTYSNYADGCRCDDCRRAKAAYERGYRARKAAKEGSK